MWGAVNEEKEHKLQQGMRANTAKDVWRKAKNRRLVWVNPTGTQSRKDENSSLNAKTAVMTHTQTDRHVLVCIWRYEGSLNSSYFPSLFSQTYRQKNS